MIKLFYRIENVNMSTF